jgi:DNA-binding protein HU-beta
MNRGELARALAIRADLDRKTADRVVTALFDTRHGVGILADALDRGERVVITGFGTFSVRERPAQTVPDPSGGAARRVGPARVPRFRPSTPLRDRLG